MVMMTEQSSHPCKYHVFLSFRGEDITTALIQAIKDSQISTTLSPSGVWKSLSTSSTAVTQINKSLCLFSSKLTLLMYGIIGEGLAKLEGRFNDKVPKWKTLLNKVANLSGFHLVHKGCSEPDIIGEIVKDISNKVDNFTELDVAEYQVGLEHRVQAVQELLAVDARDTQMIGIWGHGGIGKTTIAKAVYNLIARNFDGSCFLEDVRKTSESASDIVKLQKILLREILNDTELKVTSAAGGITMIKKKLQGKKVLLVLDDVNDKKQLDNLACQCSWFEMGSRIIITTREKDLLRCHGVQPNLIYEVQKLDYREALELFCVKAFKRSQSMVVYAELTERVVQYAKGLPLVLTVLGSSLYGGNVEMWEAALDGYESHQIKDVLKISLEGLNQNVREAFLDIACFFKGECKEYVIEVLEACSIKKYVINVLIEKALIRITGSGSIWMHDLVEEMGRDLVHEESPYDPGKRSRLWSYEDVYHVLTENIGTNDVRGIKIELPKDSDLIYLCATTFCSMNNLKLLIYRSGRYFGVFDSLPNSLRVIDWVGCPHHAIRFLTNSP